MNIASKFDKSELYTPKARSELVIERVADINTLAAEWRALEREETASIYQSFDWVKIALETLDRDHQPMIVTARVNGKLEMVLPMVLQGKTFKTLHWIGGSHANIRSGLFSETLLAAAGQRIGEKIFHHLRKSVTGIVTTRLGNQPYTLKGYRNPLTLLAHQKSVNSLFVMDLSDGFQALLEKGNAKRKRKKLRQQTRVFKARGGHEMVEISTPAEAVEALRTFKALKEQRFQNMGMRDALRGSNTLEFLDRLAMQPADAHVDLLKIYQLRVDGKIRAIFGGGRYKNCFHGYINTISSDELSYISPGEMLLFLVIEKMAGDGVTQFDLGAGDEPYKRSWCKEKTELFDTVLPLTASAVPVASAIRMAVQCKGYIRNNRFLWRGVKAMRRLKASPSSN